MTVRDLAMTLHLFSTLVLVLIFVGLMLKKKHKLHAGLMVSAFLIDLGLVLVIELNRGAIEQTIAGVEGLLLFHIIVSVMVLFLYIALMASGLKLLKHYKYPKPDGVDPADFSKRLWTHRSLAAVFLVGRLINYVTSFYIVT